MTVNELIEKLTHEVQRAANGLGESVLTMDSEVVISTPNEVYRVSEVDFDCFDPGEPWVVVIESGADI